MATNADFGELRYDGLTFAVHATNSTERFTPWEVDAYLRLLQLAPSDRVLDIGANVGIFALPASRRCAWVTAYEPDADNTALLTWNVRRNGRGNVDVQQAAIVGDARPSVLLARPGTTTRHTVLPVAGERGSPVPAVNINTAMDVSRANIVKLDAEGAELGILAGLTRWAPLDRLVCEWHATLLGDVGDVAWWSIVALLRAHFPLVAWKYGLAPWEDTRLVFCSMRPTDVALAATGWPGLRWTQG